MTSDPRIAPWVIDEGDFYELEAPADQIRFLLQYAVLAPSLHNTQPWIFQPVEGGVEVSADPMRRLAATDPQGREALLSIGAAIANLRIAAAHFGFETSVLYRHAPERPDRIALVAFRETSRTNDELRRLFPAIRRRHTNREPFACEAVDPDLLEPVCDFVDAHPETLRLVPSQLRPRIIELVTAADEAQMSERPVREELAHWVHSGASRPDGIPADALGVTAFPAATEWVVRHISIGPLTARRDRALIESASAVIVVTAADDPVSLAAAGEIMERLLLIVTREGLQASFFTGPAERDDLRQSLWSLVGTERPPQIVLRVGHCNSAAPRPTPRRPLEDVLV